VGLSGKPTSGTQNAGEPSAHGGGQNGGPGGQSPLAEGLGDVPPGNQNWGRVARSGNPATGGAQNPGEPKAYEGGQNGGPGGGAPWRRLWGVSPHKTLKGESSQPLQTPPRVGPKTLANPQPTRVGKGVQGAKPPGGGLWGVSPHKTLKGDGCQPLQPRHEWDSKRWQTLSPRGWAKGGPGGVGDVPPQNQQFPRILTQLICSLAPPSANLEIFQVWIKIKPSSP